MKKAFIYILMATFGIFHFSSCKNNLSENDLDFYTDTSKFFVDSIYKNVDFDGKKISIWVLRDNKDSNNIRYCRTCDEWSTESIYSSPVTTLFVSEDNKILLKRHFGSYGPDFFKPNGNGLESKGKLLMKRNFGAGGSPYEIEKISYFYFQDNKIETTDLIDINELTYVIFNKDEESFIVMSGIWRRDDINNEEGHFDNHILKISKFTFNGSEFLSEHKIGETIYKYPCPDEGYAYQVLGEILKYEPEFQNEIGYVWNYYKD